MRFKASIKPGTSEYSLLDTATGRWYLEEQGFGVCDNTADALNSGRIDPRTEIGELAGRIVACGTYPDWDNA